MQSRIDSNLSLLKEQRSWAISILNHRPISSDVYRNWYFATLSAVKQAFGVAHDNVKQFQQPVRDFDINRDANDETMYRWLDAQQKLLDLFISELAAANLGVAAPSDKKVFLVHGHDPEMKETVARFIQNLGLEPTILSEQVHKGRTIIEQIEAHTDVPFGIVLLAPDDVGTEKGQEHELKPRARQNVILELGFLMGRLGRDRVCAIRKGSVEIPSDFHGILWIGWEEDWKMKLIKELKAAGIDVDLNKILASS